MLPPIVLMSVRINKWPDAGVQFFPVSWLNSASSGTLYATINTNGTLGFRRSGSIAYTVDPVPTNTWFNVWVSMTTDRSDVVSSHGGFSEDTTKPTSGDTYATNYTTGVAFTPDRIFIPNVQATAYAAGEIWFDGILVIDGDYDALPSVYPE